jgi:DNA-binding transcriptional ArsR family regulator
MAFPKDHLFSEGDQAISQIGFSLSHPARLFIARTLREEGPKHVLELVKMMPLTQGSISFHLEKMRAGGLVDVEEQGLYNMYSLNVGGLLETRRLLDEWYAGFGM